MNFRGLLRWRWMFWGILGLSLWGNPLTPAWAAPFPHYQIDVRYEPKKQRLRGKMRVSLAAQAYPAHELLFALPMNRFSHPDPRGPRKNLQTPLFALDDLQRVQDDPLFPYGFSSGQITILSVTDHQGAPLAYRLLPNPTLSEGYHIAEGLLSLTLSQPLTAIEIEFETTLPVRFQEGLVQEDLVTAEWHPKLLTWEKGKWITHLEEPTPGTYEVTWEASQKGTLITTTGAYPHLSAHESVTLPASAKPLKYFPLIFSPSYHEVDMPDAATVQSFYFRKDSRRAELLRTWGEEFYAFVQKQYGLTSPWERVRIVEIRGNHEQVRVMNNLILVTLPHYKRTEILDRRVLAFASRAFGEVWFGETIWNNTNTQLWLSYGLPSFLSLKFFEAKYGKDAGIMNWEMDWLNPKYREHFFESMTRRLDPLRVQPIISPIQESIEPRLSLRVVTYKAALVISMLEYLVGYETFVQGLNQFYNQQMHQIATEKELHRALALYYPEALDHFFHQWFHTTHDLDYAFAGNETEELKDGRYQTTVRVRQLNPASMPIEVQLTTRSGEVLRQRTQGHHSLESVTFVTDSEPRQVSLDPDEELLEVSRRDNHSFTFYRVRFAFDWKKDREVMVLLIPRVGKNDIDGTQVGVEGTYDFDRFYKLRATTGYGTKNQQFLYILQLDRKDLWIRYLDLTLNWSRLEGTESRGVKLVYNSPIEGEKLQYSFYSELQQEHVFRTSEEEEDEEEETSETLATTANSSSSEELKETGDTSNFVVGHTGRIGFRNFYFPSWGITLEQPLRDLGADFAYTLLNSKLEHLFNLGFRKRLRWTWIYATTYGESPLQKKHQLASPQILRGFPQRKAFRDDNLLASRLDFEYPLIATPWLGNITSQGLQGLIFYDFGQAWGPEIHFNDAVLRRNMGIGLQWGVDAVGLMQFPLRFEIAYPLGEREYTKPQFILGGALSFF